MVDESSQRGSGGTSRNSRQEYPDRAVLGGEVGLWSASSALNRMPAPRLRRRWHRIISDSQCGRGGSRKVSGQFSNPHTPSKNPQPISGM